MLLVRFDRATRLAFALPDKVALEAAVGTTIPGLAVVFTVLLGAAGAVAVVAATVARFAVRLAAVFTSFALVATFFLAPLVAAGFDFLVATGALEATAGAVAAFTAFSAVLAVLFKVFLVA